MANRILDELKTRNRLLECFLCFLSLTFCAFFMVVLLRYRTHDFRDVMRALLLSLLLFSTSFVTIRSILRSNNRMVVVIYCCCVLFTFVYLISSFLRPTIGYDTWQMYDMSKYVFTDFGHMTQIRQHIINTHYEMAFPPLSPVLMACVNAVFNIGVNSAIYINGIASLLLISVLSVTFKRCKTETAGALATIILTCGRIYVDTFVMGLNQTTGFLFLACICYILLVEENYGLSFSIKCAIFSGLGLMNRFDFLSISLLTGIVVFFLSLRKKIKPLNALMNGIVYFACLSVLCLPWILYSVKHFNVLFVTDNGRRLFNIVDTRPSTFFTETNPALTIFDDFSLWLDSFRTRVNEAFHGGWHVITSNSLLPETVIVFALSAAIFFHKNNGKKNNTKSKVIKIICIGILLLGEEALVLATGYPDERYHLPFMMYFQVLFLIGTMHIIRMLLCDSEHRKMLTNIVVIFLVGLSVFKVGYFSNSIWKNDPAIWDITKDISIQKDIEYWENSQGYVSKLSLTNEEAAMAEYLTSNECNCLCIFRAEPKISLAKFSALSNVPNMITPNNLDENNIEEFVSTFDINYLFSSSITNNNIFTTQFILEQTPFDYLYKVIKQE